VSGRFCKSKTLNLDFVPSYKGPRVRRLCPPSVSKSPTPLIIFSNRGNLPHGAHLVDSVAQLVNFSAVFPPSLAFVRLLFSQPFRPARRLPNAELGTNLTFPLSPIFSLARLPHPFFLPSPTPPPPPPPHPPPPPS